MYGGDLAVYVLCSAAQLCPAVCDLLDCSPPGSSVQGISRQEHWSGLPFPPPGDLPHLGIEPSSSPLVGRFFTTAPPGKPTLLYVKLIFIGFHPEPQIM